MYRIRANEAETSEADQKPPAKAVLPFIMDDVVSSPSAVVAFVVSPLSIQMIWSLSLPLP